MFRLRWDVEVLVPLFPGVLIVSAAVMTIDHYARVLPARTPPHSQAAPSAPSGS